MNESKFFFFILAVLTFLPAIAEAQKREHLTAAEIEIVRDSQELDKRIEVFVKAIDRRLQALGAGAAPVEKIKKAKKETSDWGELPTGTRAQLINDVAEILDEAANNIDVIYERDEKNKLIAKALTTIGNAAERFLPQLKSLAAQAADEKEREAVYQAVRNAESVIEAKNQFLSVKQPEN